MLDFLYEKKKKHIFGVCVWGTLLSLDCLFRKVILGSCPIITGSGSSSEPSLRAEGLLLSLTLIQQFPKQMLLQFTDLFQQSVKAPFH